MMETVYDEEFTEFLNYVCDDPYPILPRRYIRDAQNPMEFYSSGEFISRYRLTKETIRDIVLPMISPSNISNRGLPVPSLIKILVTLRYYATGSFQIVCGDLHGINQSSVSVIIKSISGEIADQLQHWVVLPITEQASTNLKEKFYDCFKFPGVIGCIDCTHVPIQNPGGIFGEMYRNRKGWFSLNVQVVVGPEMEILDIVCRWPGSVHDARIFNNSRLKNRCENGQLKGLLLGDSGYPLLPYLYTPLHNPRTPAEQRYNAAHIRTRNIIERSFGAWKRRFPCLSMKLRTKLQTSAKIILACAVLHNVAIKQKDPAPEALQGQPVQNVPVLAVQHRVGRGALERTAFIERHFT